MHHGRHHHGHHSQHHHCCHQENLTIIEALGLYVWHVKVQVLHGVDGKSSVPDNHHHHRRRHRQLS